MHLGLPKRRHIWLASIHLWISKNAALEVFCYEIIEFLIRQRRLDSLPEFVGCNDV